MTKRKQSSTKTTFRQLTDDDRNAYWYVELPDDRPAKREPRVSEEEWLPIVNDRVEHRPDGDYEVNVFEDIRVGSAEWKKMLTHLAIGMQRRLFWEPLESQRP
jgi:hypothetical protein